MKEGTTITKLVMLFLVACLAAYFGIYIFRGLTDPVTTAVAYTYTVNDSIETDGLLIRQEIVLPGYVGIADVVPGEGERVGAGQVVAMVYRDNAALEREDEIQALTLEVELLQYAMTKSEQGGTAQLEDEVFRAAVELRANVAGGDFRQLEEQVLDVKRAVLRRDYTYGQGADTGRLAQLNSRLNQLNSQSARDTSRVRAERSGVYSAMVDGYEQRVDPSMAMTLSPMGLDALIKGNPVVQEGSLGKLIVTNRWYVAVALPEQQAQRLREGGNVQVGFTGDFERVVDMRVDYISKVEEGRCVVVASSDRYLAETTLLRNQTVEIIFQRQEGLRVPKGAVHILTETTTDENGQPVQASVTGVYAVVNGQAEFKPAEVLAEGRQFYVVQPLGREKTALRAGDQVIVQGREMHDGKVVTE